MVEVDWFALTYLAPVYHFAYKIEKWYLVLHLLALDIHGILGKI